ncbi:MAG: O-antigen ligase family protein [Candidatus Binatia bacterium]
MPFVVAALGFVALTAALVPILAGKNGVVFLGAILALVLLLILFDRPHLGVMTIFALWFFEISPQFLGMRFLTVPYVLSALLVVPLGVALMAERRIWILRSPQLRFLLAIGVVYLLATGWAELADRIEIAEIDTTVRKLQLLGARLAFVIFFVYFVNTRARLNAMVAVIVAVTAVTATDALANVVVGGARRAEPSLFEMNPNRLAFACLFATSLVWFYRSYAGRLWRFTLPLLFLLPATAIASGSRSGLLQGVAFATITLVGTPGRTRGQKVGTLVLIALAALLVISVVPSDTLERASTFDPSVRTHGQESLQNRVAQIGSALRLVVTHPFLGIGIGNFESVSLVKHRVGGGVHNAYLRAFVEGGILAFALYLALFYVTYRTLRQLERDGPHDLLSMVKGIRVGFVLFLIASLTGDIWLEESLYLIFAFTIVFQRMADVEGRSVAWSADGERGEPLARVA